MSLLPEMKAIIDALAERYGVTPSWVQSLNAKALGYEDQPDFRDARKQREQAIKERERKAEADRKLQAAKK